MDIRILLVGDIVGKPGRTILKDRLPGLAEEKDVDFILVNGENAAQGSGITRNLFKEIVGAGADCVTCGDHVWRRMEIRPVLESDRRLLRPANYPSKAAGRGSAVLESRRGVKIGVVTVAGRIFMGPAECPFETVDRALSVLTAEAPITIVEVHAEATSEKVAMGWKLDGRASIVFGTHTHIPTADARVLPGGTAYITDIGMTGPYDSVIGRDKKSVLHKFETSMHASFTVATGDVRLCGALVTVDSITGRASSIERIELCQE